MTSRSNAARILTASMAGRRDTPVMNLQAYAPIGGGFFSAIFSSVEKTTKFGFDDYADKVADKFDKKLHLVADSLFQTNPTVYRGILAPTVPSRRYEEDKLAEQGLRPVTADVFEDNNHQIWKLVGEGDQRQLIQTTPEDYARLLRSRRSQMSLHAAADHFVQPEFGDYAYAFVPELQAFDFGIYGRHNKTSFIISRRHNKRFNVDPVQVMEAAAGDKNLLQEMTRKWDASAASQDRFADYLSFIAMLYGKNSEYYRANEQAILNNRVQ